MQSVKQLKVMKEIRDYEILRKKYIGNDSKMSNIV